MPASDVPSQNELDRKIRELEKKTGRKPKKSPQKSPQKSPTARPELWPGGPSVETGEMRLASRSRPKRTARGA